MGVAKPVPSLAHAFRHRAAQSPEAVAVRDGERTVTYAELDSASDGLAAELARRGAGRGARVGLLLPRSADLVVAVLATLKAGAAYVPLDPGYPAERLRLMVGDADVRLVVGSPDRIVRAGLDATEPVDPAAGAESARAATDEPAAGDPAYVMYTSGSTGHPKGVVVTHRNVLALLGSTLPLFDFASVDRWALFHASSFDFSVWELWGALLTGGTAVSVPLEVAQVPSDFLELVRRERVTVLNQVPSAFRHLREAWEEDGRPDLPVRHLIFGGESVDLADVARFVDACGAAPPAVVNMYGITEATVHVTRKPLARGDMEGLAVAPIGRPLPHLSVDVLDPAGRRVEPGEVGEMWVAGAGVAAGYLNRPELTAERFRTIEIGGNLLRAYRTGDLARVLPDGELDFAGRADEQIKVRGFRIEPREVEMALSRHRLVRGAAVAVVRDAAGEPSLVACVVASDAAGQGALADLRRHSAYVLPRWMVPDRFLLVEALPLTPRGKLDRAALGRLAGGDAPGRTRTGAASDRLDRERDAVRGGDAID